jgi:hypothetical protein
MKDFQYFTIIASLFVLSCCKNNVSDHEINWEQYPVENISAPTIFQINGNEILSDSKLCLIGDSALFIKSLRLQSGEIHLYKIEGDTLRWHNEIIRKGNGPLDGGNNNSEINTFEDGSIVIGVEGYEPKVFVLSPDKKSFINNLNQWERDNISLNSLFVQEILLSNKERFILQLAGDVPSILATYELGDTTISWIPFPYPDDKYNDFSRTMMYYGTMNKRPQNNQYIYKMAKGRYIFTFSLNENNQMENINYLFNIPPKFKLLEDGIGSVDEDDNLIRSEVYCTQNYIYVAYNDITYLDLLTGKDTAKNDGYKSWFFKKIHVFDWNGTPIKTLLFDRYISNFVINEDDSYLYGNILDLETDETSIVRYQLN